jgi:hypothetical protein
MKAFVYSLRRHDEGLRIQLAQLWVHQIEPLADAGLCFVSVAFFFAAANLLLFCCCRPFIKVIVSTSTKQPRGKD